MNAAINPLYSYVRNQKQTLYPEGESDQAVINSMKLGNVLRQGNRRASAPAPRPAFSTVWANHFAATA